MNMKGKHLIAYEKGFSDIDVKLRLWNSKTWQRKKQMYSASKLSAGVSNMQKNSAKIQLKSLANHLYGEKPVYSHAP